MFCSCDPVLSAFDLLFVKLMNFRENYGKRLSRKKVLNTKASEVSNALTAGPFVIPNKRCGIEFNLNSKEPFK